MTRHQIVEALLRLYPAEWRREYGDELLEILADRPVTAAVAADVVWSALRQRLRHAAPSTVIGLTAMLVVLTGFALTPASGWRISTPVLMPTSMNFPTFSVTFMTSQVYVVLLVLCGWWSARRYGYSPRRCGLAAMRMSLIAGMPVIAAGLLLSIDAIHSTSLSATAVPPGALEVMAAPTARLPLYWIWGAIGGAFGQRSLHKPIRA